MNTKHMKYKSLVLGVLCCVLAVTEPVYAGSVDLSAAESQQEQTKTQENENDTSENETAADEPAQGETEAEEITELPAVTELTAVWKNKKQEVRLDWNAVEGAACYRVCRKEAGESYEELAVVTDTGYVDQTAKHNEKYTYRVTAEAENGVLGEPATVQLIPKPASVKGLRTTCQAKKRVLLEWNKSTYAKSYRIYRKTGSGAYRKIADTKKTHYTDRTVQWDKVYNYKILAVNETGASETAAKIKYAPKQVVNPTRQKYSYANMQTDMRELAEMYSDYCTLSTIGTSVQGRKIYDFAIGNPNAKKSMLVVCTLHAREYICSVVAMKQIEHYLSNYNRQIDGIKPADLLNRMQIHYIVMSNPDGVMISQTKDARWKANANGVNLNQNFPATPFRKGGTKGSFGSTGDHALSEPESKAIATLTKRLKKEQQLVGVLNYHAMGRIIFGDCSDNSIKKDTQKMYTIAKKLTGYRSAAGYYDGTPSHGGSYREYVMDKLDLPSITIEMGTTTAPCAFWEYSTEYQKNRYVPLKIANALK